jgi:ribosomal protein S18 acetylase RimI-like enzyme
MNRLSCGLVDTCAASLERLNGGRALVGCNGLAPAWLLLHSDGMTEIRAAASVAEVMAAAELFDDLPREDATAAFLAEPGHHLLLARLEPDGPDVGFVSGVEMVHPDKGREMFLYELGVDESARGRGVGRALVQALLDLARDRGCYGAWTATEPDNLGARATYRSAGATEDETVTVVWTF